MNIPKTKNNAPQLKKTGKNIKEIIIEKQNDNFLRKLIEKTDEIWEREFKFLKDRKYRADYFCPKYKIAIEIEGGIFSGGRHTRGKGYISDMEKYNLMSKNGIVLLRYSREQMTKNAPINDVTIILMNKDLSEHSKLFNFFMWFRENGEKHMDKSIEKMIEIYLKNTKTLI